jgi:hypothetical protein
MVCLFQRILQKLSNPIFSDAVTQSASCLDVGNSTPYLPPHWFVIPIPNEIERFIAERWVQHA